MFLKTERENTSDKSHYENVPFEVPESWEWTTINEICSKIPVPARSRRQECDRLSLKFFADSATILTFATSKKRKQNN